MWIQPYITAIRRALPTAPDLHDLGDDTHALQHAVHRELLLTEQPPLDLFRIHAQLLRDVLRCLVQVLGCAFDLPGEVGCLVSQGIELPDLGLPSPNYHYHKTVPDVLIPRREILDIIVSDAV